MKHFQHGDLVEFRPFNQTVRVYDPKWFHLGARILYRIAERRGRTCSMTTAEGSFDGYYVTVCRWF